MELSLRSQGKELVARIDCTDRPRGLEGGGTGWFTVKEIQWLYNWKLRAQVAVVQRQLQELKGLEVNGRPEARRYLSDRLELSFIVEADVVEVVWSLPDSLCMMQHAFGCSDGGDVTLSSGRFRVQPLLWARSPKDYPSHLRRNGPVLDFVRTRLGQETVVGVLVDHLVPRGGILPIPPQLMKKPCIKEPKQCTKGEIAAFCDLVREGGEVDPDGLEGRVKNAKALIFRYLGGTIIGVAALKNPGIHRDEVFASATVPDASLFSLELGWVFVPTAQRGKGFSHLLVQDALSQIGGANVFATTRENNVAMQKSLERAGFKRAGEPWQSIRGDYKVVLYLRKGG